MTIFELAPAEALFGNLVERRKSGTKQASDAMTQYLALPTVYSTYLQLQFMIYREITFKFK
jgi:hypothetical protein